MSWNIKEIILKSSELRHYVDWYVLELE